MKTKGHSFLPTWSLLAAERRRAQPRPIDLACASGDRQSKGTHLFWYDLSCSHSEPTARPLRPPHPDPCLFTSDSSVFP